MALPWESLLSTTIRPNCSNARYQKFHFLMAIQDPMADEDDRQTRQDFVRFLHHPSCQRGPGLTDGGRADAITKRSEW